MAVVERHACDGCDRQYSLSNLSAVTMPGGTQSVCCPECRRYAESVADTGDDIASRRRECDGCTDRFVVADLEEVVLSDGTRVFCCPNCAQHAPGRDADSSTTTTTDHRDQTSEDEQEETAEVAEKEPSAATQRKNLCQQCTDWYSIELYRVVTLDGRTEKFCPDCTDDAKDDGIIKGVLMRRAEAYEVLEITHVEDEAALRDAYISRVKEVHPDRQGGSRTAFKEVQRAYERLQEE
ncbi:J domain-containing protein [Haloarchaeobius sp. DFWS5]|uniref:J domain-containing protein n=1 Tax=Haloarchaeobius sp. DFWS5 TaxID=3446114 RepID=UPI003EBD9BEE